MTHEPLAEGIQHDAPAVATAAPRPTTPVSITVDLIRGGLIGLAETVPGVSGGTVALITGVYLRVLASGKHLISGLRMWLSLSRRAEAKEQWRKVEWGMLIPLVLGMGLMVLLMAGVMSAFVTTMPEISRGLFLGMIAASVVVPLLMVDWRTVQTPAKRAVGVVLCLAAAVAAFIMSSAGAGTVIANPPLPLVFFAAAAAVCALALPGVSGSFLLLLMGLYVPTLNAVHHRDLGYIAVFGAGALVGMALFVRVLHWLMHHHHAWTMIAMSGLLLGSLRALWPWQAAGGAVEGPGTDWVPVLGVFLVGLVAVGAMVAFDHRLTRRRATQPEQAP